MAIGDYILCCECECKLIYDGDRGQREWWNDRWGKDPQIKCPDCDQPAQQEPVAWMCHPFGDDEVEYGSHQECENCIPLYTRPQAPVVPPHREPLTDEQRVKLRDAFAQALTRVYVCGRVWEAWQYGTMSEGDFQPAGECEDVLDSLVEAAYGIGEKK